MRLVYEKDNLACKAGDEVKVGDVIEVSQGERYTVTGWDKPTAPHKSGYVYVIEEGAPRFASPLRYYTSVIDAAWIEREDRGYVAP